MKKYKKKAVALKAIWSRKQKTPQLQGISPADDAACLKPNGGHVAERRREKYATHVNICSYNVRTLSTDEELEHLLDEIEKIEWDVIGLCETYRKGEGLSTIEKGHYLYEVGKTEEYPHAKGVALLVNAKIKDCISNTKIYSDRVIKMDLNLQGQDTVTIIMTYAPTSSSSEEEIETHYEAIEKAYTDSKSKYKILIGDFNAKIGIKEKEETYQSIGPYGIGVRNDRGERLIEFAEEHKLVIANTLFKKAPNRYWTWESPGATAKNMIDLALSNKREIVTDCGVITKADKGSDHRMIRIKIKINKKLARVKSMKRPKPIYIDNQKLLASKMKFQINLKNRFEALKEIDAGTFCEVMIKEANKLAGEKDTPTKIETEEDIEIRELDDCRKKLRNKECKSNTENIEYAELKKTVKKKRRTRARRKRKEHIEKILENGRGPKEVFKTSKKKVINEMKNEKGEVVTSREEVLKVCAQFYQELYSSQINNSVNTNNVSPDNSEPPPFIESEVEKTLKEMKQNKAPGNDQLTCDIIKLGGNEALTQITKIFNTILKNRKIPPEWKEAKVIILHKKGDRRDIKNYRPISLLPHMYKLFTRVLQKRMEKILDANQPREQAGFRKGFATTDHLHSINQVIEKSNEFNLPLCIAYIDYEKAFDSVEHEVIFQALRNIGINESYINIIEDIYTEAKARVHIEKQESEEINILRGVRQGDPISPKLFTAAIQEVFKNSELESRGIDIDGEKLTDLRFADDVALVTSTVEDMEVQLNILNEESKKVGLRIHRGKTKFMTNSVTTQNIEIEGIEIEKVEQYKYLGQTIALEDRTVNEVQLRIKAGWAVFGKYKEIFQNKEIPICLKRKVFNQCIIPTMTYGCQTWSLTKDIANKMEVCQRKMERKMLGLKQIDRIPNSTIRERSKVDDILKVITKTKWKWAGHVARMNDNRWTVRCTEWQVRHGKRSRGRPKRRWHDDIHQWQGATWHRKARDRQQWKDLAEGYFQQWRDTA